MPKIINLNLLEHSTELKPHIFINKAIVNNNLIIVLGSPGSGKTSILKKYALDNDSKAQFLKIKKFLKLDKQVKENIEVLLLDGLDEYRSLATDKTFVIEKLANKLKELNGLKIVISCRELDWYGESDTSALKDELDSEAVVFSVQPLNDIQQTEMAIAYGINNPEVFIEKFSSYGFLDNPQMFTMIATLYIKSDSFALSSKAELYKAFIRGAKEQNIERTRNISHQLSDDEILKYSGYLAFFYMFTEVDSFKDDLVDTICVNEKGFTKEKLMQTLNTTLFDHKIFIHRTIPEFALAYFLVNEKMKQTDAIDNERVKALFVRSGKIPTELRGVYAWICSLSKDISFIEVDPFYQAVYGDNSLFSITQKQEIVLSVKKYAEEHPYFIDFWGLYNQFDGLSALYDMGLDNFYKEEFEEAKLLRNHYNSFIVSILNNSCKLSKKIEKYLQKKLFDVEVPTFLKDDILKSFENNKEFLLKILNSIKDELIEDDNNELKEFLLKRLYPNIVTSNEIIKYLKLYHKSDNLVVGHGLYLFDTRYEDKFELVTSLLKLQQKKISDKTNGEHKFYRTDFMGKFISDFLYETILKYPKEKSAKEIYKIIVKLREYVKEYKHFEFKPYELVRKNDDKKEEEELFKNLSNELYAIHIDKAIKLSSNDEKKIWSAIFHYKYIFPYHPNKAFNILLTKINDKYNLAINKQLFSIALTYIPFGYDEDIKNYTYEIEQLKIISNKYGFDEKLNFRLSKQVPEWEIEQREHNAKEESKRLQTLTDNESYFVGRTDEEIATTFGDLKYISDLLYIGEEEKENSKYLTKETFDKLKIILKNLIQNPSINSELTTLNSLAKLTKRERYIEQVYYVSLSLNKFLDNPKDIKIDGNLLDYIYITNLKYSNIGNIIKSDFNDYFEKENPTKATNILRDYIRLLINEHYNSLNFIFEKYINKETELENLKRIASSYESNLGTIQEEILYNILSGYAFDLSLNDLNQIDRGIVDKDKNTYTVRSLILLLKDDKSNFNMQQAVSLYSILEASSYKLFKNALSETKVKIIDYMFSVFNTEKSIEYVNGFQSSQSQCADFLRDVTKILNIDELRILSTIHGEEKSIWRNRILNQIDTLMQQESDQSFDRYSIEKIKEFVLSNAIISREDFFEDILIKINNIKLEIEDNRTNQKNQFYNDDGSSKNEEYCRDVIHQKLNDKYGYNIEVIRERYEANDKRVDINIRYKANLDYEVQVECKKDKNSELYTGIEDQLIGKYFSSGVQFGIYMIFYFGDKNNKELMLQKIYSSIPNGYQDKIKIICIDFRL